MTWRDRSTRVGSSPFRRVRRDVLLAGPTDASESGENTRSRACSRQAGELVSWAELAPLFFGDEGLVQLRGGSGPAIQIGLVEWYPGAAPASRLRSSAEG